MKNVDKILGLITNEKKKDNYISPQKYFWIDLLNYWTQLIIDEKYNEFKFSICNWKKIFSNQLKDEEKSIQRLINKITLLY